MWRNDHTKRAMAIPWDTFKDGATVGTQSVDNNYSGSAVKWEIHYCSDEPTNVSSGGEGSTL